MAKAVFTARIGSHYDDLPEERYHFPVRLYMNQVRAAVGDLIVYYEPRRNGGRQVYFAYARLDRIEPDPADSSHAYAYVSDYTSFPRLVPFKEGGRFYESVLEKSDESTNRGAFGRAVRVIPQPEFEAICWSGLSEVGAGPIVAATPQQPYTLSDGTTPFDAGDLVEREVKMELVSRQVRDDAFARAVRAAYDATCALTGLKLINGGGRAEMEAAHIKPIGNGHRGPDSVRNGIALCRTAHWMFDRGFVSFGDDYRFLLADKQVPPEIRRLFNRDGTLRVPDDPRLRPHPRFLRYHREHLFKG